MNQDENNNGKGPDSEQKTEEPVVELPKQAAATPLFLKDGSEGKKGNAQDEKDKTEE